MALSMTNKLDALKIQGGRRNDSQYGLFDNGNEAGDVELDEINAVLHTADDVTKVISTIKKNVERVKEIHNSMMTSFNNQVANESYEAVNGEIKKLSHRVHTQLKKMKTDLDSEERGPNRNSADFRIKKAQFTTLTRLFKEAMEDYNTEQENYREKSKDRIQKQLKYAGRNVSEDQLETMLESDDPQVFTQDLVLLTAQKKVALSECEARHIEILNLEQNIRELHDMFYDIALLVEEQGELINRIDRNVDNAGVYVDHGRKKIKEAVRVVDKGRKLKWILCCALCSGCCCLILIGAVVAGLVVYFQQNPP